MKTIVVATAPPPEPPAVNCSMAGVGELIAAAQALEPQDPNALNGVGDLQRVNFITTAGAVRRLTAALQTLRSVPG